MCIEAVMRVGLSQGSGYSGIYINKESIDV